MSEPKIITIEQAPQEFFDKLREYCVDSMEGYLDHVLQFCKDHGTFKPYQKITGMLPAADTMDEDTAENAVDQNIYPGEVKVGELEGFDDDYIAPVGKELDENGKTMPLFNTGRHSITVDIPNLHDLDDKEDHIKDLLEDKVLNEILFKNLKVRENRRELDYFNLKVSMDHLTDAEGQTLPLQENYTFKESAREELQPTIDRFVNKLYQAIVKTEIERQHGKTAAGSDEADLEMDYHTGARIKLDCSIDTAGDLDVTSADRRYLETIRQRFTIPIPYLKGLPNIDEYLRIALFEGLEVGAVHVNLSATNHPEYEKMFYTGEDGGLKATEKCKKLFSRWRHGLTRTLLGKVMKLNVGEEGQVLVEATLDENGLHDSQVEFRRMEHIRSTLPNTEGMSDDDRLDAYDTAAMRTTYNLIKSNLQHMSDSGFDTGNTLAAMEYLMKQGSTEDADVLVKAVQAGELNMDVANAAKIERLYNHVLDKVTNQMNLLGEKRDYPFYVGLIAWGTEQDTKGRPLREGETGLPLISMDPAKKVYLNPKRKPGKNLTILNIPAIPECKLTRKNMEGVAEELVEKTLNRIVHIHMQAEDGQAEHPYYPLCFMPDPKNPKKKVLTDKGAIELESTIKDILKHMAITTVQVRAITPEQFSGFRMRTGYKVTDSDSFYVKPQSIRLEYFIEQGSTFKLPIPAPSMTPEQVKEEVIRKRNVDQYLAIKDIPARESALVMDEFASRYRNELNHLAKDIVISMMAMNMQGTSHLPAEFRKNNRIPNMPAHPAFQSYFTNDESGNYVFTPVGQEVLGKIADNYVVQVAARLEKTTDAKNPFMAGLQYAFNTTGLKGFAITKAMPIRQSMYDSLAKPSRK